jgi:glycosyltransferase involved in cell wall biosynthesis
VKILTIHNSYQARGGEDVVVERELALLKAFGHETVEYRRTNKEIGNHLLERIAAVPRTLWSWESYRDVSELIRSHHPDIAHIHNTLAVVSPSVYYACRKLGVPVVQTLHNYRLICPRADLFRAGAICEECVGKQFPWPGVKRGCYHSSIPQTAVVAALHRGHQAADSWAGLIDRYIVPSDFAKRKLSEGGVPGSKIEVKPNFVFPDPGVHHSRSSTYAAFVGRLSPEKRLVTLLKAWKKVGNGFSLYVAGTGDSEANMIRYANDAGLENVRFLGSQNEAQVFELIKGAAFLIFPSEWYETFGLGMIEAYACGVPVIASRMGAMQEIVRDSASGLLFTAGNADGLAVKINWAIEHPAVMAAMGETARRLYEDKYSADTNHRLLMGIYQGVIEARRQ